MKRLRDSHGMVLAICVSHEIVGEFMSFRKLSNTIQHSERLRDQMDERDVPSIAPLVDGTSRGHRHHVSVAAGEIPEDMALHGELTHEEGIFHASVEL